MLIVVIAKKHFVPNLELFFWLIVLLVITFISEFISFEIANSLFSNQANVNQTPIFTIVCTGITAIIEILIVCIIKFSFFKKGTYYQSVNLSSLLFLSLVPIISIIILFCLLLSKITTSINSQIIEIVIITGIIFMNIGMLYLYSNLIKHFNQITQITLENKALESEVKRIEALKISYRKNKAIQHDINNHFLVVLGLIEADNISEAKHYLQDTLKSAEMTSHYYTSDNILNYLLNEKIGIAHQNNIEVASTVFLSKEVSVNRDILAIVLGNLMDNAISACMRLANQKRKINLTIKQQNKDLMIDITNSFDAKEIETRKQRQIDGMGRRNISRLVKKMGGIYQFWTEEDEYFVSIIFFNIYS
jgi:signal transduction histidine kinase